MVKANVKLPEEVIREFCHRWNIVELALFGSALRDDFRPESDMDFLVTFDANARWTLLDHCRMEEELSRILRRDVDLISRRGIEASRNRFRRTEILSTARPIYHA